MSKLIKHSSNSVAKGITKHVLDGAHSRTIVKTSRLSPHIKVGAFVQVDKLPHKKDYKDSIHILRGIGMAMCEIAEACGISTSYSYKLNRKK